MKAFKSPFLGRFAIGLASASLAFAAMAVEPANAQPTVTPSLFGEQLSARSGALGNVGTITISANCDAPGGPTISYMATGPAIGPYAGTYIETGMARLGQLVDGAGPVVSFVASFTIDSPIGDVTGTKLLAAATSNVGTCRTIEVPGVGDVAFHTFSALATYTAEIRPAVGSTCTTGGSSNPSVFDQDGPGQADAASFHESFTTGTPCVSVCPPGDDGDEDGLVDGLEVSLVTVLDDSDSDDDGILDGNDDANGNGEDDEDEDDDDCPDEDSDGDGEDDEDEDDD